jgi:hypothetical protein
MFFLLSYCLQYSFFVLCASCFNGNMPWRGSILVKSVWCPGGFLYLNGTHFLKIWENFCYYFVECITVLCIPLACTSSPSSMPMIYRFDLLMELLSSCEFFWQLLSLLRVLLFFIIFFVFRS